MIRFSVGDRVIIRYGKHLGQKADIIKTPEAGVYKVKAEDGFILYYSGKGLEGETEGASKAHWHPVSRRCNVTTEDRLPPALPASSEDRATASAATKVHARQGAQTLRQGDDP